MGSQSATQPGSQAARQPGSQAAVKAATQAAIGQTFRQPFRQALGQAGWHRASYSGQQGSQALGQVHSRSAWVQRAVAVFIGSLAGWLAGLPACRLAALLAGLQAGRLICWLAGRLVV